VPHHDGVETNLHSESGFASVCAALTASAIASSIRRGVPATVLDTTGTNGAGVVEDEVVDVQGFVRLLVCTRSSSVEDLTAADAHEEERSKETSRM
jgi:hypothetical protein